MGPADQGARRETGVTGFSTPAKRMTVLKADLRPYPPRRALDLFVAVAGSVLVHVIAFAVLYPFLRQLPAPPEPVLHVDLAPPEPLSMQPPQVVLPQKTHEPPQPRRVVPKPKVVAPTPQVIATPTIRQNEQPAISQPAVVAEPAPEPPSPSPPTPPAPAPAPPPLPSSPPSFGAAYLNNPRPEYPRLARRNGDEGTVMLRVLVTRDGRAAKVELDKTSGSSLLDGAAMDAVKEWRFVPARKGTEPVEDWVRVPIVFRLVNAQ